MAGKIGYKRVLEAGHQRRSHVRLQQDSTKGATIGTDVYDADGNLWDPESVVVEVIEEIEAETPTPSVYQTIWRLILEIPPNIVSLAALSGVGFATRLSSASDWANRVITGIGRIKVVNGDGVAGNPVISLLDPNYVAVTSAYNVLVSDDTVDAVSGTFADTLPTAIGVSGKIYNLKNSGTGVITLDTTLAQTIDGNASGAIKLYPGENLPVQSDGANWIVL